MQALDAKSLSLSYGEDFVIQNLDLEIPKGKITVFIGGNGSGKSTLLRSFARLLKPKEGSIILDGEEIAKRLSILPQGLAAPEGRPSCSSSNKDAILIKIGLINGQWKMRRWFIPLWRPPICFIFRKNRSQNDGSRDLMEKF